MKVVAAAVLTTIFALSEALPSSGEFVSNYFATNGFVGSNLGV